MKIRFKDDGGKGFVEAWKRAQRGEAPSSVRVLAFDGWRALFATLVRPWRWRAIWRGPKPCDKERQ